MSQHCQMSPRGPKIISGWEPEDSVKRLCSMPSLFTAYLIKHWSTMVLVLFYFTFRWIISYLELAPTFSITTLTQIRLCKLMTLPGLSHLVWTISSHTNSWVDPQDSSTELYEVHPSSNVDPQKQSACLLFLLPMVTLTDLYLALWGQGTLMVVTSKDKGKEVQLVDRNGNNTVQFVEFWIISFLFTCTGDLAKSYGLGYNLWSCDSYECSLLFKQSSLLSKD